MMQSAETLEGHWQDVLQQFPRAFDLWEEYLSFRQKEQARLDVKEVFQLYADTMRRLRQASDAAPFLAVLFQRLCLFLEDAGFTQTVSFLLEMLILLVQQPSLGADTSRLRQALHAVLGRPSRTLASSALLSFLDRASCFYSCVAIRSAESSP